MKERRIRNKTKRNIESKKKEERQRNGRREERSKQRKKDIKVRKAHEPSWESRHILMCHGVLILRTVQNVRIHHHGDNCVAAFTATWILGLLQCYAKQSR
jgi:hypothetical protein